MIVSHIIYLFVHKNTMRILKLKMTKCILKLKLFFNRNEISKLRLYNYGSDVQLQNTTVLYCTLLHRTPPTSVEPSVPSKI